MKFRKKCILCNNEFIALKPFAKYCKEKKCQLERKKYSNNLIKIKKDGELGYKKKNCIVCNTQFKPSTSRQISCSKKCYYVISRISKNEYQKKYHNKKKKDGNYIAKRFILRTIRRCINSKKYKSKKYFKSTKQEFVSKIESMFMDGMSWLNYGEWHIDHIKPLSSFCFFKEGKIDYNEVQKANSLDNLQPLWAFDNLSKNNKMEKKIDAL